MATPVRILGYGGAASVDGVQVLITSGNFNREKNFAYMQMMDMKPDLVSRTKVTFADGTWIINGTISFDMNDAILAKFTTGGFLQRNYPFDVVLFDGTSGFKVSACYYSSLSLTGSGGGLISCSMNFMSKNDFVSNSTSWTIFRSQIPAAYWQSGVTGAYQVRDWSLNINQEVVPKYMNEDSVFPRYLRVGLWDATLEVNTYTQMEAHTAVEVKTKTFTLAGNSATNGYTFGGQTEFGTFNHRFETASPNVGVGSAVNIIS